MKILFLTLCLAGCASLGAPYAPTPLKNRGMGRVYVYRVMRFTGSSRSPEVEIDGVNRGSLLNGAYLSMELEPGEHMASLAGWGEFPFQVEPGRNYYLRVDFNLPNLENYYGLAPKKSKKCPLLKNGFNEAAGWDSDEVLRRMDLRAQNRTCTPAFMFVQQKLAREEIISTHQIIP